MAYYPRFTVSLRDFQGVFCRVSTGVVIPSVEAGHPLVGEMTEEQHEEIRRAALWLADESGAEYLDLDSGYRVGPILRGGR